MKKVCLLSAFLIFSTCLLAQSITQKLSGAITNLENDPQMESAMVSLYVINAATGKLVFEKNSRYGMAAASTQKLFTAAAILEALGPKFTYNTVLNLYERADGAQKSGFIDVLGSGDPSLGSWRFPSTRKEFLLSQWSKTIANAKRGLPIKAIYLHDFENDNINIIPDGYIWQDIGNYYGAGTSLLNWNENQYDIAFRSGNTGKEVSVIKADTIYPPLNFDFSVKAGAAGSGDNTYIYTAPLSGDAIVQGTIPPNQTIFTISGSVPDPGRNLGFQLKKAIVAGNKDSVIRIIGSRQKNVDVTGDKSLLSSISHRSPTLDTLVFWFLRKSINLYGEAFVKTLSKEKGTNYLLDKGLEHLTRFWKEQNIRESEMVLQDGSGLSPQNRVTTKALTQVLGYSTGRAWFPAFLHALPTYNGMKMKSGSINGARSFAGYHTASDGTRYIFAIIVNNYNGSATSIVRKIYTVLDILK